MKFFRPIIILFLSIAISAACSAPVQIASPTPKIDVAQTQSVIPEGSFRVSYDNISFVTPPFYSNKIISEVLDLAESTGPDVAPPAYTQIQLRDNREPTLEDSIPSLILIYPVADLSQAYAEGAKAVSALETLLQNDHTAPISAEPPFWPLVYFTQVVGAPLESFGKPVFTTRIQYLDFQSGHGLRYLTFLESQPPRSHRMRSLIYTYQGLTNDKQFYVSVIIPVNTEDDAHTLDAEFESLARQDPPDYPGIREKLNSLTDDNFYLTLDECDNLITSLVVNP